MLYPAELWARGVFRELDTTALQLAAYLNTKNALGNVVKTSRRGHQNQADKELTLTARIVGQGGKERKRGKPEKPYSDLPLTPHPTGKWCKKVRWKLYYFGD